MENLTHAAQKAAKNAEQAIHRAIEALLHLCMICKRRTEEIIKLKEFLHNIDQSNSEFHEIIHDHREFNKMNLRLTMSILSIGFDFLASFQAVTILCSLSNFPSFFKLLIPVFLIVLEIGISYFQIVSQRNGEKGNWITRNVQYLVLIILCALSLVVVIYSATGYNANIDNISFTSFLIGTILIQLFFLVGSLCLHIWLIRNAEFIAETFAFFRYYNERSKISNKINRMEKKNKKKYVPAFVNDTYNLIKSMETFKQMFPGVTIDFIKSMPTDLIQSINQVMGREVFSI